MVDPVVKTDFMTSVSTFWRKSSPVREEREVFKSLNSPQVTDAKNVMGRFLPGPKKTDPQQLSRHWA